MRLSSVIWKSIASATCFATLLFCLPGCVSDKAKPAPSFSNAGYICELSTLEVYYHNVARAEQQANGPFAWFFENGYKQIWFEYSGVVEMGIDVSQVSISGPDQSNVVSIALPQAEVLDVNVDEKSISEPVIETGFMTDFTTEEKTEILGNAQSEMRAAADQDDTLKSQARERAKSMLESYVKNVGGLMGEEYTIRWVDVFSPED